MILRVLRAFSRYQGPVVKKHAGNTPRGGGSPSHDDDRRRSGFRPAARLEDLADSALDEDTQTSLDALPESMVGSSEPVTTRHQQLADQDRDDDADDDADDAVPTVETRVDSAQMVALLAQAGLPSPFESSEDPLDGDTVADPGTTYDPYDDTSPTLPAPPKRPRAK